jgi:uracil-DNA glycosylase
VLGSDWENETSFDAASKRGTESSTARKTIQLLARAGFDTRHCWYSNAWPLLRSGSTPEQGHQPMQDDAALTIACRRFLRTCIEALQPRLVVTMGKGPAWLVGPLAGERWFLSTMQLASFVDSKQMEKIPIKNDGVVFAAITHPSRPHNAVKRSTDALPWSRQHEIELLTRAREMADIPEAAIHGEN